MQLLLELAIGAFSIAAGVGMLLSAMVRELESRQAVAELEEAVRRRRERWAGAGRGGGGGIGGSGKSGAAGPVKVDPSTRRLQAIVDWMLAEELRRGR